MKHAMKALLLTALILPISSISLAQSLNDAVQMVAQSRQSTRTQINSRLVEVVFVGEFDHCASVSVIHGAERFEHFRVCAGGIVARNTVSPSWPDDRESRAVLATIVQNAIYSGEAVQTDENGYLIRARALDDINQSCNNLEVVISYDGDLVDRQVKQVCGYPPHK